MGNFNRNRGFGNRNDSRPSRGFGGGRSGGRSFGGDRGGFSRDRPRPQMSSAVCAKCGQECQVPFKPTGDKPVYCSACFGKQGGASSRESFRESSPQSSESSSISKEQFKELNSKLDKILKILENIEFEEDIDEEDSEDEL